MNSIIIIIERTITTTVTSIQCNPSQITEDEDEERRRRRKKERRKKERRRSRSRRREF